MFYFFLTFFIILAIFALIFFLISHLQRHSLQRFDYMLLPYYAHLNLFTSPLPPFVYILFHFEKVI